MVGGYRGLAVNADLRLAQRDQIEPGRGDDDISFKFAPRFQFDAGGREMIDMIGHNFGAAFGDRLVHIAIGDEAQPLFPRVVGRGEVTLQICASRQLLLRHFQKLLAGFFGLLAGMVVN